ncbi:hypothetical protein BJ165DRAFT_1525372 [Panaeolus papilionaceus]|nr:hypothetical protein BJ165DRAFT_1525372 [Panaeolus papilionaceus]
MQNISAVDTSRIYGPFVGPYNIESFRYILYRCGALAGGEALLEKLTGERVFRNAALELFVEKEQTARLCDYLTKIGYGYEEDEETSRTARPWLEASINNNPVNAKWTFSKGELRIVVSVCPRASYEGVILKGNTCLMAIGTHNCLYCPYPESTMLNKDVMIAGHGAELQTEWRKKYAQAGWNIVKDWDDIEKTGSEELQPGLRWLGDTLCKVWTLTPHVNWDPKAAFHAKINAWTLLESDCGHGKPTLHYKVTKPWPNIKYRYTVPDRESATFATMLFSGGADLADADGYKDEDMESLLTSRYEDEAGG